MARTISTNDRFHSIYNIVNSSFIINNNNLPVHIYVKFAYQTTNATYILPRNLTLSEMVRQLQENILRDFATDASQYELVEAGQTMPQGIPAEEAPALVISSTTIRQRFNDQNCVALYIRLFPATASSSLSSVSTILTIDDDTEPSCMVCQESPTTLTTYFGCRHHICDSCCAGCINAGISQCAICRHPR